MNSFLKELDKQSLVFPKKEQLHPTFWSKLKINSIFAAKLREIAQDLVEDLDISKFLKDIIITGSIAGYNWHNLSDIDLHLIIDFSEIDENEELVADFFHQKRINWNRSHNIILGGHEVEIYFQDIKEDHHAAGIYSLVQSRWLQKPEKEDQKYDLCAIKCKAESLEKEIDMVSYLFFRGEYRECHHLAQKIRKKIKKLRHSGLSSSGIHSVENLAFKVIRNRGKLANLMSLSTKAYDHMHSKKDFSDISLKIN